MSRLLALVVLGTVSFLSLPAAQAQGPAAPPPLAPPPAPEAPPPPTAPAPPAETGPRPDPRMGIGVDLALDVPMGDLSARGHIGFGGFGRFEYVLSPRLNATARVGYLFHPEKNMSKFFLVPVLAGAKFDVFGPLFVTGELGFVFARVKATTGRIFYGADNSGHLGVTLGAGYRLWRDFDARAGLHLYDVASPGDWTTFLFSLGYTYGIL